ncbi:TPA: hypothetical protein NIA45_004584 [Pseudomonas aeruginosa]|nr:hypothetical protein [Pseudomonas aeruginosa]
MQTYDPYEEIPFLAFGAVSGEPHHSLEHCRSLMHFIEAEKFLGVDDRYRRFLLQLSDREDLLLETAGVSQAMRRADWSAVRDRLIRAGVWMQLVQNQDALLGRLMSGELSCDLQPINTALQAIRTRIAARPTDPLRQVLIAGPLATTEQDRIYRLLNSMFSNREPDELLLIAEPGACEHVATYARERYIPMRVFPRDPAGQLDIEGMVAVASHTYVLTLGGSASEGAEACYSAALSAGKTAHRVDLEQI